MPETDDLTLLIEAARAAGEIARQYFRNDPQVWEKPDDAGPVTEADLAVNAMLEERLQSARVGYGWLSEESPDSEVRLALPRCFVIDPLDGT
ncbi:MAG: inositol monophosphatase family protein, partial [Maritimibacter sp.]